MAGIAAPWIRSTALGLAACGGLVAAEHGFAEIRPILERHCLECHDPETTKGKLDLSTYGDDAAFLAATKLLDEMDFLVAENEMPPPDATHPMPAADRARLLSWIHGLLDQAAHAIPQDPGIVVMPRLTPDSYDRALSQLAGVPIAVGAMLAAEAPAGEGFTNVGEAHMMEPSQLEKFLHAASAALAHARVSPVTGLSWSERPPGAIDEPWRARKDRLDDFIARHQHWAGRASAEAEARFKREGFGHAAYWWQAWRWRHRAALGLAGEDIAALAAAAEPPLQDQVLRQHWAFFDGEASKDAALAELQRRWRELPAPPALDPAAARERLAAIEAWFHGFTAFTNDEPDIELKSRDVFGGREVQELAKQGRHPYRFDFSQHQGEPIRRLYLILSDASDGAEGDVAIWRGGAWLRGKQLQKQVAERIPWHQTPGAQLRTPDGASVAWGSHPDGRSLEPDAVGVRAPAILVLELPPGVDGLELELALDPEATVQSWVAPELPASTDGAARHWIIGRRVEAGSKAGRRARDIRDRRSAFISGPSTYTTRHGGFVLAGHDALGAYYETDMSRGGDLRAHPERPYVLEHAQLLDSLSAAERRERETTLAELELLAQAPHQDRVRLFAKQQIALAEGVAPSAEQLAALDPAARQALAAIEDRITAFEQDLATRAATVVADFTARAWRRQPESAELEDLLGFYRRARAAGFSYDGSVKQALRATLCSVHFIYRYQASRQQAEPYPIAPRGLADRLALLLWGGLPDAELLAAAADGSLAEPEVVAAQARRMLGDQRARALAERFAGEWLGFAGFGASDNPDPQRFERFFTDGIAPLMEAEAVAFVDHLLRGGAPLSDLYRADYGFLNQTLARHYGVDGVEGDDFRKVALPARRHGGVLTLGATLTRTSTPLRTSAVVRGAWILEQILGEHLPEPPADVPPISPDETDASGLSVAQQLARHRESPACMGCHVRIDPLGVALEHFDPVGRWRDAFIDGKAVAADDQAADGTPIAGLAGLTAYLRQREERILERFCRMFAAYALGRAVQPSDRELIAAMVAAAQAHDLRFEAVLEALVTSRQFRFRRDETASAASP